MRRQSIWQGMLLLFYISLSLNLSAQCFDENIARSKAVIASSGQGPNRITDGNQGNSWNSDPAEPEWIYVDLGIVSKICAIAIFWGDNYAVNYDIDISDDAENWSNLMSITDNTIDEALFEDLDENGRYLRLNCLLRADTMTGFSLRELEIYGLIEAPYQILSFESISDHLSSDDPIELVASATSGLPVSFEVLEGPAEVNGNLLSFTGAGGTVIVEAQQEGNADYFAAEPIQRSFDVVDPSTVFPEVTLANPSDAYPVIMKDELGQIMLSANGKIERPQWFSITDARFEVDGDMIEPLKGENNSYYFPWTPTEYGSHSFTATFVGNNGNETSQTINFEVVDQLAEELTIRTFDQDQIIAFVNQTFVGTYHFPTHIGAYNNIMATLSITCPDGGCDPWDRLATIQAKAPDGKWIEIIRYITPFGVECTHTIDVTEYAGILQGYTDLRAYISTWQRGWELTLDFDIQVGTPEYRYSKIEKLWYGNHPYGNLGDKQPADTFQLEFAPNVEAARLRLITTGHGWGETNTQNAAEFQHGIHHVRINNENVFEQDNWVTCDPNPDGCSPQNGTWYFDRAGWCPGAISHGFDYDMNQFLDESLFEITYRFDPEYVDFCHPNNPLCITGVTCSNCNAGFNPQLEVAANLISYSNSPIENTLLSSTEERPIGQLSDFGLTVHPNPSDGTFWLTTTEVNEDLQVQIFDMTGKVILMKNKNTASSSILLDIKSSSAGMYLLKVLTKDGIAVEKLVLNK